MRSRAYGVSPAIIAGVLFFLGVALAARQTSTSTSRSTTSTVTHQLPVGTLIDLRLNNDLSSKTAKQGEAFSADVTTGVRDAQGRIVIPAGSTVEGTVSQVQKAGTMGGQSRLQLRFQTLLLADGTKVPMQATLHDINTGGGVGGAVTGSSKTTEEGGVERSKTRSTVGTTAAGGGVGAIIGGIAGGGKGAGIGAIVGAGAGAIMGSRGGNIDLKKGTEMTVRLDSPMTVKAVK